MQGLPHGYSEYPPPDLGGDGHCPHCLIAPCIVTVPPDFVTGQCGPHIRNTTHCHRLYKQFWKALKELGLWNDDRYSQEERGDTLQTQER